MLIREYGAHRTPLIISGNLVVCTNKKVLYCLCKQKIARGDVMTHNYYELTILALKHPEGKEILDRVLQVRDVQQDQNENQLLTPWQKKMAIDLARRCNTQTPKHVNNMTISEYKTWVNQLSA